MQQGESKEVECNEKSDDELEGIEGKYFNFLEDGAAPMDWKTSRER